MLKWSIFVTRAERSEGRRTEMMQIDNSNCVFDQSVSIRFDTKLLELFQSCFWSIGSGQNGKTACYFASGWHEIGSKQHQSVFYLFSHKF